MPVQSIFSVGNSRSLTQRLPSRLSKGRSSKAPQHHPPPNYVQLEAKKIPGYETFTLDEYIRSKPDVIHYVDSPVIRPKIEDEEIIGEINSIEGEQITKISPYDLLLSSPPDDQDDSPPTKRNVASQPSVQLVRYDPDNPADLEKYFSASKEVSARITRFGWIVGYTHHIIIPSYCSSVERSSPGNGIAPGSGSYLPIMVGSTMFPLPHIPSMQGSRVRSIVLLVPQDYQL